MGLNDTAIPGDPLEIDAEDWNAARLAGRLARKTTSTRPDDYDASYPCTIAKVRNDSGVALSRFDVVGLGAPILSPTDNLAEFKRQPTFKVVKPVGGTHEGKFGVLLEPLASGSIGAAAIAGGVPVQMTGTDVGFAEITNGQTYLTASASGSAKVLWSDSGSSTRWAYVRMGAGAGAGSSFSGAEVRLSSPPQTLAGVGLETVVFDATTYDTSSFADGTGLVLAANKYYLVGCTLWVDATVGGAGTLGNFNLTLVDTSGNVWHESLVSVDAAAAPNLSSQFTFEVTTQFHDATARTLRVKVSAFNTVNAQMSVKIGSVSLVNTTKFWAHEIH